MGGLEKGFSSDTEHNLRGSADERERQSEQTQYEASIDELERRREEKQKESFQKVLQDPRERQKLLKGEEMREERTADDDEGGRNEDSAGTDAKLDDDGAVDFANKDRSPAKNTADADDDDGA